MANGLPGLAIQHVLTIALVPRAVSGPAQIQRQPFVGILVMVMHGRTLGATIVMVRTVLFKITMKIFAQN